MWTRKELKGRAKVGLKRNYWKSVFLGFLVSLIYAGTAANGKSSVDDGALSNVFAGMSSGEILLSVGVLFGIVCTTLLISAVFHAFIYNPLKVGISAFCIQALDKETPLQAISAGYKPKFFSNVWALFWRDVFVVLWSLLLIIPGIVKSYSYRLVPYVLAENPGISTKEALRKSSAMMQGNKWNTFVLDLSFLGWNILSAITFGILGVFYVEPYKMLTDAALYEQLKRNG